MTTIRTLVSVSLLALALVGLHVERGRALFEVVPRVAADRSLATLEAELATVTAELETARVRLSRLEELLELGAASEPRRLV